MFIKNEDQNFSLFNYVNEQTNEIEKLEETVLTLRKEEAKVSGCESRSGELRRPVLGTSTGSANTSVSCRYF